MIKTVKFRKTTAVFAACLSLALCSCGPATTTPKPLHQPSPAISATTMSTTAQITSVAATTSTTAQTTASTADNATTAQTTATTATTTATEPTTATTVATTKPTVTPTPEATELPGHTADQIHDEAVVIDTHCDTVLKVIDSDTWLPVVDIARKTSFMVDIPKLQAGGIDLQVFASYTSGYALPGGGQDFHRANSRLLALINGVRWTVRQNPQTLLAYQNPADLDLAVQSGKIGILASIEGAYSLSEESGLELLRQYYDLGIRMLALTWNYSNALGEGVNETYRDGTASSGGLTDLGRSVVLEMNKLGMIVDVSHLNETTFWDVLAVSTAPVIASHSSVDRLCPHVRNLTDSQIQAIAAAGGVVHVNYHRPFLATDTASVTIDTLIDHIDAVVELAGINFVGLGSDFDGAKMPQGLEDATKVPLITRELLDRGYSENDIKKILGGNASRLFRDVNSRTGIQLSGQGLSIVPVLVSGSGIATAAPVLTATITAAEGQELDISSLSVIVDGLFFIPDYDPVSGSVTLALAEPLTEKFHVVTFQAAAHGGEIIRKTLIFYIE